MALHQVLIKTGKTTPWPSGQFKSYQVNVINYTSSFRVPNFIDACVPVKSCLNIAAWEVI